MFVFTHRPPTQRPQPPQKIFKKRWILIKQLKDMIHDKIYPPSFDTAQAYARRTEYKKF